MKSVIGLLFAAAIFATVPISAQVTPRGAELSVDQAHLRARPPSSAASGEARVPTRAARGPPRLQDVINEMPRRKGSRGKGKEGREESGWT